MRGEEWGLMGKDPRAREAGIVLPPGLLQPFLLRFRREELHIMAFFRGHSDYEAVEAMIRYRDDGTPSIRAILTRHDQSQIDHVNDDDLSAEGHGVARQTCRRDIALAIDALPGRRHARLEFDSHAGEPVVLDITTVGEPDPKRGGISDPGSHSPNTSLPLMRRRASTLAGAQTAVFVGGKRSDGKLRIARKDAPGESIEAFVTGDGLRITRIGHLSDGKPLGGLDLAFDEAGHFSLAMEGETIVSGSAEAKRQAATTIITLSPTQPDWAVARQVRVTCSSDGDLSTAVTTIGRS